MEGRSRRDRLKSKSCTLRSFLTYMWLESRRGLCALPLLFTGRVEVLVPDGCLATGVFDHIQLIYLFNYLFVLIHRSQ